MAEDFKSYEIGPDVLDQDNFLDVVVAIREKFKGVLSEIGAYEQGCQQGEDKVPFYGEVSKLKSTYGQALMLAFWREMFEKTDLEGLRKGLTEEAKNIFNQQLEELWVSEEGVTLENMYGALLVALKQSYGAKGDREADELFVIAKEAMNGNEALAQLLKQLGSSGDYIPAEVWTPLNDNLWLGSAGERKSVSTLSYAKGDLLTTIFKEAVRARNLLIEKAVDSLEGKETVRILDAATGGGAAVKGIIKGLKENGIQYEAEACDSDQQQVDKFSNDGLDNLIVYSQNMAEFPLTLENCSKYDLITESIGGHHLHPENQVRMFKNFTHLLKPGAHFVIADVYEDAIKILGGLGDDLAAPEHDVRTDNFIDQIILHYDGQGNLTSDQAQAVRLKKMVPVGDKSFFPQLQNNDGSKTGLHFVEEFEVVEEEI